MLCSRPNGNSPSRWRGTSVLRTTGTWLAIRHRELDLDHVILEPVEGGGPADTRFAFRADDVLVFPVDHEGTRREPCAFFSLPVVIVAGWADQLDAMLPLTIDKQLGVHEPRIGDVLIRQQLSICQRSVDLGGHGVIGNRGRGGFDIGDNVRSACLTCLGQMNLVACPTAGSFRRIAGVRIIR